MKDFKAGYQVNQGYYKSFQPTAINKNWEDVSASYIIRPNYKFKIVIL